MPPPESPCTFDTADHPEIELEIVEYPEEINLSSPNLVVKSRITNTGNTALKDLIISGLTPVGPIKETGIELELCETRELNTPISIDLCKIELPTKTYYIPNSQAKTQITAENEDVFDYEF